MNKLPENNSIRKSTEKTLVPDVYEISSAFAQFIAQADKQAESEKNDNRK